MAADHYAVHAVYTSGEEGDVYSLGCFVKADAIPGKTCQIAAAGGGQMRSIFLKCPPTSCHRTKMRGHYYHLRYRSSEVGTF